MLKTQESFTLSYRGKNDSSRIRHRKTIVSAGLSICVLCSLVVTFLCLSSTSTLALKGSLKSSSSTVVGNVDLSYLNKNLRSADEIINWACTSIAKDKLVQMSSFGPSGLVILHKLHVSGCLDFVPMITIDTLHLFPETHELISIVEKQYKEMYLHIVRPEGFETEEEFDDTYGADLWKTSPDKYAYLTKIEPTLRALNLFNPDAWITGRRRSQGGERTNLKAFEADETSENIKRFKINPLFNWSYDDVWKYIRIHNLPYNSLHDKGYKSIGDHMTTVSVSPDAEERSGRFQGLHKTECGMHAHREKIQQMQEEAGSEEEMELPSLPCEGCIDVDETTFDSIVVHSSKDLLIEFYSPLCGACQEFSPTFNEVAKKVKSQSVDVARFAITYQDVPQTGIDMGFVIDIVPKLFFVTRNPFKVNSYQDGNDLDSIIAWLKGIKVL